MSNKRDLFVNIFYNINFHSKYICVAQFDRLDAKVESLQQLVTQRFNDIEERLDDDGGSRVMVILETLGLS